MVKLDCSVVGCAYNTNNCCRRENICVCGQEAIKSSETACKSFSPKGTATMTSACCGTKKDTEVSCEATNCRYNDARICKASHIGIVGLHAVTNGETECGSFEAK